jgi:hypothetical protein
MLKKTTRGIPKKQTIAAMVTPANERALFDRNWVENLISLRLLNVFVGSPGELLQDVLCKHIAAAAESGSLTHQLEQYVFALLADGRDVFHLDTEFAALKVRFCGFKRTS